MGSKQWGLVAAQAISAGSFVMEYIGRAHSKGFWHLCLDCAICWEPCMHECQHMIAGEVIPAAEAAERSAAYNAEEEKHTYFMHLR